MLGFVWKEIPGFRDALVLADCDSEGKIVINFEFCLEKELNIYKAALVRADCNSEWLFCINGVEIVIVLF
jgi:hypothetical protein